LVRALDPGAFALNCFRVDDGYFTNLELDDQPKSAAEAIRGFVDLIDRLPPNIRSVWDAASKRDFSIGINAGSEPCHFEMALEPAVLELAARVGARIVLVVYVHARTM